MAEVLKSSEGIAGENVATRPSSGKTVKSTKSGKGSVASIRSLASATNLAQNVANVDDADKDDNANEAADNSGNRQKRASSVALKESNSMEEYFNMVKSLLTADKASFPPSYTSNNPKEELVLSHVENFIRQYKQLFPNRKELLLLPKNEFGVRKFVCTTIRPTQLKFKELYDYRDAARFVSDYLSFEALDPPFDLPTQLPSPTFTLKVQSGNCFDYAIVLCSLLRGAGYHAFVCSGYATRDVTLMDDSRVFESIMQEASPFVLSTVGTEYLLESKENENGSTNGQSNTSTNTSKYRIKGARQLNSTFLLKQAEKKRKEEEARIALEAIRQEEERARQRELAEQDDLKGLRVHAWILLLPGKREIAEPVFIEPTTGKVYATDDPHYLGVESVFNNHNYWVNMQVCYDGLKGISFDLGDNTKWEFVLIENSQPGLLSFNDADDHASDEEEDDDANNANASNGVADLPPSWVLPLSLDQKQFEKRCPSGHKVTLYRNCIAETFAEYQRKDGMLFRVTLFAGEERKDKRQVIEFFSKRRDKLVKRIKFVKQNEIHEHFEEGRAHALRLQVIVNSKMKEMHFYSNARHDGLYKREETSRRSIDYYRDREDKLIYKSATYEAPEGPNSSTYGTLIKLTEKYARNEDIPASEDIAKRTFFLKEERIRVIFHLEPSRIIPCIEEFRKQGNGEQKGASGSNISDFITHHEIDPFAKALKKQHLYAKMMVHMRAEQNCMVAARASEKEVQDIIRDRNAEEQDIQLSISVYDTIRNEPYKVPLDQQTATKDSPDDAANSSTNPNSTLTKADFLSPFLVNYDATKLSREDANAIKEACLKSLKERLIEKASIMQKRLDEETAALQKAQQEYQRDQDTLSLEETEAYMGYCQEAMFRIQILEKRLAKAPEKYVAFDKKVRSDPRLSNLLQ